MRRLFFVFCTNTWFSFFLLKYIHYSLLVTDTGRKPNERYHSRSKSRDWMNGQPTSNRRLSVGLWSVWEFALSFLLRITNVKYYCSQKFRSFVLSVNFNQHCDPRGAIHPRKSTCVFGSVRSLWECSRSSEKRWFFQEKDKGKANLLQLTEYTNWSPKRNYLAVFSISISCVCELGKDKHKKIINSWIKI